MACAISIGLSAAASAYSRGKDTRSRRQRSMRSAEKSASSFAKPALAKYRDPASGAVWSGRGRAPRWIAGQDRENFLIHTPT
ncbi:H-NS histone family protein [Burkholderia pseudomallei]|nr:H-NS histone family protein [Burkholderia pseudomallei]MBF3598589.1 H-NS histone family protein [Burkholderia pseudomallei]